MMIEGLRPYPDMRPTGLPGLGPLPSHWTVRKLRHCGTISGGMTPSMGDPSLWDGDVPWVTPKDMKRFTISAASMNVACKALETTSLRLIPSPAVLLVVRGMILARRVPIARTIRPVTINQDMKAITPAPGIEAGYLAYRLDAAQAAFVPLIDEAGHGTKRFPTERWRELPLGIPPLAEQRLIVRFLDWHGARTAKFIRTKKQLIALLNEQKQAIIHHAVTRGLDSNAKLKPSGISWLGDVPKHWDVVALKRVAARWCDGPFGSGLKSSHYVEKGIRVIRLQNIGLGYFRNTAPSYISEGHYRSLGDHSVLPSDLIIAGLGEDKFPAGRACVAPGDLEPAMVKADCFRVRLRREQVIPEFLAAQLTTTARAASAALSTGATRQRINLQSTVARSVALPSKEEQLRILSFIQDHAITYSEAIDNIDRQVALVHDFHTRVIADAVSGRLDVREAAASLPEQIDGPELIEAVAASGEFEDSASEDFEPEEEAA